MKPKKELTEFHELKLNEICRIMIKKSQELLENDIKNNPKAYLSNHSNSKI